MAVGSDYPELAEFCFFLQLFLASKIVATNSLGGCVKLTFFLGEALDLTVRKEIEQRGIDQTVETVTAVSVDDGFTLETLQLWGV